MEHLTADEKVQAVREWLAFMAEHLPETFTQLYTIHEAIDIMQNSMDWWSTYNEMLKESTK